MRVAQIFLGDSGQGCAVQVAINSRIPPITGGNEAGNESIRNAVDVEADIEIVLVVHTHELIGRRERHHNGGKSGLNEPHGRATSTSMVRNKDLPSPISQQGPLIYLCRAGGHCACL